MLQDVKAGGTTDANTVTMVNPATPPANCKTALDAAKDILKKLAGTGMLYCRLRLTAAFRCFTALQV